MFHYSDFPTKIETQIETWKALFKKKNIALLNLFYYYRFILPYVKSCLMT